MFPLLFCSSLSLLSSDPTFKKKLSRTVVVRLPTYGCLKKSFHHFEPGLINLKQFPSLFLLPSEFHNISKMCGLSGKTTGWASIQLYPSTYYEAVDYCAYIWDWSMYLFPWNYPLPSSITISGIYEPDTKSFCHMFLFHNEIHTLRCFLSLFPNISSSSVTQIFF